MTGPPTPAPPLDAEGFVERARAEFGHSFVIAIAARLRVSDRHVSAWAEGKAEPSPRHAEALDRLFLSRARARDLVGRFMAALHAKAAAAGIEREDIAAALAADTDVQLARTHMRDASRQPLSRRA